MLVVVYFYVVGNDLLEEKDGNISFIKQNCYYNILRYFIGY